MLRSFILYFATLIAISCAGEVENFTFSDAGPPVVKQEAPEIAHAHVKVWVQSHRDLPVSLVFAGCTMWEDTNVTCEYVKRSEASIRIFADESPCMQDADGSTILGRAYIDGTITVYTSCMPRLENGTVKPVAVRNVIAHEIGHTMGIWDHVSRWCDSVTVQLTEDGVPICGSAIMNPGISPDIHNLLFPDFLAFEHRNPDYNSLVGVVPAGDPQQVICALKHGGK